MALTLTAAPVAAHLCTAWCSPQAAVTDCHPAGSSAAARAGGQDGCDALAGGAAPVLPQAVRRAAAGPIDDAALAAAPLGALVVGQPVHLPLQAPAARASLQTPPLLITLRI